MDCAEEIAALKKAVGPVVGSEELLSFNLMNGKMTVLGGSAGSDEILRAVRSAGLEALPWSEEREAPAGLWQRHGRSVLCAASGSLTALGVALQASQDDGLLAFLTGAEDLDHGLPLPAVGAYALAVLTGVRYVLPKALAAARALRPDMNLLMTIAVLGAIGIGEWFEAATVSFLFALALLLESWSVGRARRAIESLMDLSPDTARYRDEKSGEIVEAAVDDVPVGAVALVRPGDRIPLDGEILVGETSVDQAPITGESLPVDKSPGDPVFAGTVNAQGAFEMRTTHAASQTTLARIIALVEDAQANRSASEQWVERFARYYTPSVLALAVAVALLPPLLAGQSWGPWFYNALVLLVIACPCALVISTPVSIVAGLASAARAGVLIKGGVYLESPAGWRAVALDKTGTLTLGEPRVQRVVPFDGHDEEELLTTAAALESESSHPLARAILESAKSRGYSFEPARDLVVLPGKGAQGSIGGRSFWIGSHRLLEERGAETESIHETALELEDAGHSLVAIGNDQHVCGLVSVADEIRPDARHALDSLRVEGIESVVMLTGDNERTAQSVGARLGIDDVRAELLPADKVDAIVALRERYGEVAMIGDGVNDAPALAASTCAVAMGAAGTDAAIETADVALMSDDLSRLPWLIRHSRRTLAIVRQNIAFALGVKAVFVFLTFLGAATLWMAIAADMGASLLVIFNGLRLLRG